jgi:hypothetical protein
MTAETVEVKRSLIEVIAMAGYRRPSGPPTEVCILVGQGGFADISDQGNAIIAAGVPSEHQHAFEWINICQVRASQPPDELVAELLYAHEHPDPEVSRDSGWYGFYRDAGAFVFYTDPPELIPERLRGRFAAAGVTLKLASPETETLKIEARPCPLCGRMPDT